MENTVRTNELVDDLKKNLFLAIQEQLATKCSVMFHVMVFENGGACVSVSNGGDGAVVTYKMSDQDMLNIIDAMYKYMKSAQTEEK